MKCRSAALWLLFVLVAAGPSAAAAVTGWYLLEPPLLEERPTPEQLAKEFRYWDEYDRAMQRDIRAAASLDRAAPLSRWTHISSFDTATTCENARQRLIDLAKGQEKELRDKYPDSLPTLGTHLANEARCIASDDPRLASR